MQLQRIEIYLETRYKVLKNFTKFQYENRNPWWSGFEFRIGLSETMQRAIVERRIKRTLVTVNLVSRRLVINRCWRKIDRYLLTVDDSTFSRAGRTVLNFRPCLLSHPLLALPSVSLREQSRGTFSELTRHSPGSFSCVGQFSAY